MPEVASVVREEVEAGVPAPDPPREEVDREGKPVHLREERHDEGAEEGEALLVRPSEPRRRASRRRAAARPRRDPVPTRCGDS